MTQFMFSNFFSENCAVNEIMSKLVEPERPQVVFGVWLHCMLKLFRLYDIIALTVFVGR
jgi:hypothetical protein